MSRLTVDERRRANRLRQERALRQPARAITVEQLAARREGWGKSARLAGLVTVGLAAALALVQLAQELAVYGPGSLLDWLLPRL